MKFPRLPRRRPRFLDISSAPHESAGSRWSTALLMVGSALVGATAVAVWNRRTIADIRSQFELGAGPDSSARLIREAPRKDDIF